MTLSSGPVSEFATFAMNATPRYVVTVSATGLTTGGTYSVMFNGTTYVGSGTFALPSYIGGDYSISVPIAYDNASSLTRFWPTSFSTNLGAGPGGTFALSASGATIGIVFETQYELTVSSSGTGTVSPGPGTYWETAGTNQTTLTATPGAGQNFVGWSGTGVGSINATTTTIQVTEGGPVTEAAQFVQKVPPPPATYMLTVTETGLPSGTSWSFSAGITGYASTTTTDVVSGLNGTYTITIPAVRMGAGTQYLPSITTEPVVVTSDQSVNVAFSGQYQLTVVAGAGGTATPGTEWVAQGSTVSLAATASSGYYFVGWIGSGTGNYTGSVASGTVTMSGVITETAQFAQTSNVVKVTPNGNNNNALPSYLPWAALAALLVVGLLAGYLMSRRGGSPPPPPTPYDAGRGRWPAARRRRGARGTRADGGSPEGAAAEYDEST